jgi:alpha-glucosidase
MTLLCVRIARSDAEVREYAGGCTIDIGGGVLVRLTAVEQDMIRVAILPSGSGPRLDRTWMAAPGLSTLPEEGRSKDSTEDFAMPPTTLERTADGSVRLSTGRLRVTVPLSLGAPLCLTFGWLDEATGEWRLLMQDRPGGAYYFGAADGRSQHFIVRGRGDAYYGCGERSGALDLAGRRIDMRCVDAMGVREQWGCASTCSGAVRARMSRSGRGVPAACPRPSDRRRRRRCCTVPL